MRGKLLKVISLSMMLMLMFSLAAMPVMAFTIPQADPSTPGVEQVGNAGASILSIIQMIGIAVAVIILVWLAVKYITAAPSDKADVKKSAVAYVIGAVLLFAASGVLALIQNFGGRISEDLGGGSIQTQDNK